MTDRDNWGLSAMTGGTGQQPGTIRDYGRRPGTLDDRSGDAGQQLGTS